MNPSARLQAAINVLDRIYLGEAVEKALTGWARSSRYAGSGDRAAVRDHVFDALRCKRSFAALGGADTGRGLILGGLRVAGDDVSTMFTGLGHSPATLTEDEIAHLATLPDLSDLAALDCPDWLAPALRDSLGGDFEPVMDALRRRAPIHLRVNTLLATLAQAQAALSAEGIMTTPHPLVKTALEVTENARKIRNSAAFVDGLVELQDAASQAIIAALPIQPEMRVLDYCAGGGGKALARAALGAKVTAHDISVARMADVPERAERANVYITCVTSDALPALPGFEMVLIDAPCSGSGSWRRAPAAKWALTPERLAELMALQAQILDEAAHFVAPGGSLAYATCSLLSGENSEQVQLFIARHPSWNLNFQQRFTPLDGGDGFYVAHLTRD
jgi:16S rRNA (cytosine967-C5)-methyltransferase